MTEYVLLIKSCFFRVTFANDLHPVQTKRNSLLPYPHLSMMKDMKFGPVGCVSPWLARIGFGVALAGFGVYHYRFFSGESGFYTMATGPLSTVPVLAMIAGGLAYVVPALEIVGGLLFAVKQLCTISKFCILASLGGILGWAGLTMMVGTAEGIVGAGQAINGTLLFLLGYLAVKKMKCCCSWCSPGGCGCGSASCNSGSGCNCGHDHKGMGEKPMM